MKYVTEEDLRGEAVVWEGRHGLPKDIHKANPPEVSAAALRDQSHHLSSALVGEGLTEEGPVTEHCLNDGPHLLTMGSVRSFLPHCLPEPLADIFCPYA